MEVRQDNTAALATDQVVVALEAYLEVSSVEDRYVTPTGMDASR
jgi:hypothetical protein